MIHKDPFDRVIIAQSLSEKMPVLSSNPVFAEYGVENLF
jgi:PIN domain nuclease of toxin-antitoxin system